MRKDILIFLIATFSAVFVSAIEYTQRRSIQSQYLIKRVTYSEDETLLLMLSDYSNKIIIYDAIFMRKVQTLNLTFQPTYCYLSPKNNYIAIRGMNYKITFFAKNGSRFTENPVSTLLMQHNIYSVGFSQDQNSFYIGTSQGLVYVYRIQKKESSSQISLSLVLTNTIDFASGIDQFYAYSIFQKSGKLLLAGGDYVRGKVALYNPKDSFSLIKSTKKVGTYARFSPDQSIIVTIQYGIQGNGTAYILNASTLQLLQMLFVPLLHQQDIKISVNSDYLSIYGQIQFAKKGLLILQRQSNPLNWTEKQLISCRTAAGNFKGDQIVVIGDSRISQQIKNDYQQGYLSDQKAQEYYVDNQYLIIDYSFCSQQKFYEQSKDVCQACQIGCKICQNSKLCYQCSNQLRYVDKISNQCVLCKQPCVTCLTEEKCLSCKKNFIFNSELYTCVQQESGLLVILIVGLAGLAILLLLVFSIYKTIQCRKNKDSKDQQAQKFTAKRQSGLIQYGQEN